MTLREELLQEIEKGKSGKNSGIPFGYKRIDEFIDIDRHTMYTIGGETGAGKSTICQDMFIIRPLKWYIANKDKVNVKLSIIYFGMERRRVLSVSRWMSRLIFEDTGLYIPSKKILGKYKKDGQTVLMTEQEEQAVNKYSELLDKWQQDDTLIYHQGSKNPSGISRYLEMFAKKHGEIKEKVKKEKEEITIEDVLDTKQYIPNHPNHIVLVITDHISILQPEREGGEGKVKMNIDKFSRTMREAKDLYGFSPVVVQQLNRNMSDIQRQKMGDLKPKLSDYADSSSTSHDSEVILALHDPYRHGDVKTDLGYDITRFRNERGDTYYRALYILKCSHDTSNLAIQMALQPQVGILKPLPRSNQIDESIYEKVVSGMYFVE